MTPRYATTSPAYQEALDWLYSFINTEHKLPTSRAEFNLPRTEALLRLLGDPQLRYPSVVIAGTKGKGSTAAMIESILRAAGMQIGLYTSPHLHSFRERIQIDRQLISQATLVEMVEALKPVVGQLDQRLGRPSVFELGTALALLYFARRGVDFAVLEIGLGGRFDAVNVVTPLASAITSISFDHRHILGETLGAIAFEKAGILKPGVPAVTVPQQPEAMTVIAQVAEERGAPLFIAGEAGLSIYGSAEVQPYPVDIRPEAIALRGPVQLENARLATGIALLLRQSGYAIPAEAMAAGLATVTWPARLEVVSERPLVVADGAHNGDSARKLLAALRRLFRFERLILVFGALADKEIDAMAAALVPEADAIIITRSRHPRSATLEQLESAVKGYLSGSLAAADDVPPAIEEALRLAGPNDLVCVTGSLAVAAAAREFFGLGEPD